MNRIGLAVTNPSDEARTYFYIVRRVAFLLIIGAVVDNNRSTSEDERRGLTIARGSGLAIR